MKPHAWRCIEKREKLKERKGWREERREEGKLSARSFSAAGLFFKRKYISYRSTSWLCVFYFFFFIHTRSGSTSCPRKVVCLKSQIPCTFFFNIRVDQLALCIFIFMMESDKPVVLFDFGSLDPRR